MGRKGETREARTDHISLILPAQTPHLYASLPPGCNNYLSRGTVTPTQPTLQQQASNTVRLHQDLPLVLSEVETWTACQLRHHLYWLVSQLVS